MNVLFCMRSYRVIWRGVYLGLSLLLAVLVCETSVIAQTPAPARPVPPILTRQMHEAIVAAQRGDEKQALALANAIVEGHPEFVPGLKLQATLLEDMGQVAQAAAAYQKALKLAPNDAELLLKAGAYQLLAGERHEAIQLLLRCLKTSPRNGDALYYLAQAYHLEGENELALKTIRESLSIQPGNVPLWQKFGELLCSSGNYEEGLRWLLKAQRADSTLERIDFDLAAANYNNMDFAAAVKYSTKAVQLQPSDLNSLTLLAAAEEKLSHWQEAKDAYQRILTKNNEDVTSLLGLGHCELELKNYQASVDALQAALKIDPTRILAHFFLSRAFAGLGNMAEARHEADLHNRMMDQVSFAPPAGKADQQRAIWEQARQLLTEKREDEAIAYLREHSKGAAENTASIYVLIASLYLSIERVEDANRTLARALALDPKVRGAYTYRGILALQQGQLGNAESDFNAELARDPNYQPALAELGEVRYRQMRWREAAEQLAKSKTTIPSLLYMLCESYFQIGKVADADLTAETLAAYARNEPEVMRGLIDLLNRNGQAELAQRLSGSAK